MSKLGVGRYLRLLGVMEIAFAALFVVPARMKLGFILASCYFGGAIATELSQDVLKVNPLSRSYCSGSALSFGIARFSSDTQFSNAHLAWKCTGCGNLKLTKPVSVDVVARCPRCKAEQFVPQ
jgi:hypothetical protein